MQDSSDEIHLVDHTTALPASDTDEYPLVQPVEVVGPGLDLDCGTKGVFGGVDGLPTDEALENFRASVAHALRSDIEHISSLGFQRVADVAEHSAIRKNGLPIGAGSGKQYPAQLRSAERPAVQWNDPPVSNGDLANALGVADARFQSVDQVETWIGKTAVHDTTSDLASFAGLATSAGNQAPTTTDRASAEPTARS